MAIPSTVTYVHIKPAGTRFKAGESIGEVESVKTTSDVYCSLGGEITDVNPKLADNPGLLNSAPYGDGWLVKIRITDKGPMDKLMKSSAYDAAHPS